MRRIAGFLLFFSLLAGGSPAFGYWVWSPKTGKWIDPRTQPKDTPSEQLQYARGVYEAKDHQKAVREFLRLVRHYPKSAEAPEAQFMVGQCYEAMDRPYLAFQMYKKLLEVYPYSARFKDAVSRSFAIGEAFSEGQKVRPLHPVPVAFPALDKAVEIFETIVAQAPYGEFGDQAQFRLGQTLQKLGNTGEALKVFERLVQEYPRSSWVEQARYRVALCAKQVSLKPSYDQEATDQAITWFEEFIASHPASELGDEARVSLQQLRTHKAESLFEVAGFYARQKKWLSSARYYRQIVDQYGDTPWAPQAVARLTEMGQQGYIHSDDAS